MSENDDEVIKEFLVESYENLDQLDRDFIALEQDPNARDRIGAIFRTIHTVKGTSGFFGFTRLESLAHAGENLLSRLRDGRLVLTPEITTALLTMVDAVRKILKQVEISGNDGTESYASIIETLERLQAADAPVTPRPPAKEVATPPMPQVSPRSEAPAPPAEAQSAVKDGRPAVSDSSIRVDVGLLDKLMNLVGELVLARNQILQFGSQAKDTGLLATSQRLNLITTELQEGVMKTRMQPIGSVWSKLPRVVRDLALACGKEVALEMEGKDTDLDRTIIEAIKDPLTHIVRNSVDHGIETPQARTAKGKPPVGRLLLRAFHEGGQVNIEISDDGGGIDHEKVRKKALDRGLITGERAKNMGPRELIQLIFVPGFSTADSVTNVSGRGVGMDVVKTNIEKIGGTVDIQSKLGEGTTLKIKIPLTLAIIPALVVTSRGERFAIPQVSLLELVRLEGEQALAGVENIHGTPVYRLRGKLLPLVYLNRLLGLSRDEASPDGSINIVVVRADDRRFGLVVDAVNDTEEIVVKPLGKELKWLSVFAGATIMGDGKVALILDVLGMAQRANVVSEVRDRTLGDQGTQSAQMLDSKQSLLLFSLSGGERMAIPLSMVARLEEFGRERLEQVGTQEVVQYRGEILPLIHLGRHRGGGLDAADDGPLQVVVSSQEGRSVGLVVDRIVDIVEEAVEIKYRSGDGGVVGAGVIQGKVTNVLDLRGVIRRAVPHFLSSNTAA